MKYTIKILLFAIFLLGCSSNEKKAIPQKTDLEMEVINDILSELIPEKTPCMVVPIEGEERDDYNKRLQTLHNEIDSVGKKIEIVGHLNKLDSIYIEAYERLKGSSKVQHLLNAPNEDRTIDSSMIHKIKDVNVLIVKKPRSTIGGLTDCYTLGQISISRVGFNKDSTRAAFTYFIDDGSCTGGKGGIIDAELKDGKWQIKK